MVVIVDFLQSVGINQGETVVRDVVHRAIFNMAAECCLIEGFVWLSLIDYVYVEI